MSMKKLIIIVFVIILLIIIIRNWDGIRKAFGAEPKGKDKNAKDVYTTQLNEVNTTITDLQAKLATANTAAQGGDNTAVDEANKLQKQIEILKLEKKTATKFSVELIDLLMKQSLADLIMFNTMTNKDLWDLFILNFPQSALN